MRRFIVAVFVALLLMPAGAWARDEGIEETRTICAFRQARMYIPIVTETYGDMPVQWEVTVCSVIVTDGKRITLLTDKPIVKWEVNAPYAAFWSAKDCTGQNVMRSDGSLWVYGSCEVTWRTWATLVPVPLATFTVPQEFTYTPSGYQDVYYSAAWRGTVGERPLPME